MIGKTEAEDQFNERVFDVVSRIPKGRVMTYGHISVLCGKPRAARVVGGIAHNGPQALPWQRVVKAGGHLAEGFPGGLDGHMQVLQAEGIEFTISGAIKDFDHIRINSEKELI